jgi:CBS domain-containing protein
VGESEVIGELEPWMNRFRFHHLPVVTEGMKLVGLITRTDYLHAALGVGPDGKPTEKAGAESLAGAIMRRNVVTAHLDDPLITACQVMLHEKLSCLPVILEDGTLAGIVTESDFVRFTLQVLERQP